MTQQEIQYLLQMMNSETTLIKGYHAAFHAQLMSKLNQILQEQAPPNNQETDDGS